MPRILDVEAALLLLEIEPPFDQRAVQLARRRMAKRWHPDIAPPGRRHEHQRHLQAINEAADELERLAETSRGRHRQPQRRPRVGGGHASRAREDAGRRAYENEQRERDQRRGACQARPVRLTRPRPLGRPPLRALHLLPGVGRWHRHRDLLLRRRGGLAAVGAGVVRGRRADGPGRIAAVRRLLQARRGGRSGRAVHDRRPARARRGQRRAGRPAARLRARRRARQPRRAAAADRRLLAGGQPPRGRAAPCATGPGSRPTGRPRSATRRGSTRTWAPSTSPPTRPCARPNGRRATPRRGSGSAGCGCGSATGRPRSPRWSARD